MIRHREEPGISFITRFDCIKEINHSKSFYFKTSPALDPPNKQRRRKPREFFDEVYTDKDRAAAVSIGAYDIKQSLSLKRRKDRNEALQLPEEADAGSLLALGMREFKNGNIDIAVSFITKAYIIKNF